jgi:hypothetical protein
VFVVAVVPELRTVLRQEVVNELLMSDKAGMHNALKKCFHSLMTCPKETIETQLQILLRRLASLGMRCSHFVLSCLLVWVFISDDTLKVHGCG